MSRILRCTVSRLEESALLEEDFKIPGIPGSRYFS